MTNNNPEGLVSPSDIAGLTGYTRGAVSNWRRRSNDFPEAVAGTTANPLFPREHVLAWLEANDKPVKKDRGESAMWAALNVLRDSLDMSEAAMLIVTLACARKLAEQQRRSSFAQTWHDVQSGVVNARGASEALQTAFDYLDPHGDLLSFEHSRLFLPPAGVGKIIDAVDSIKVPDLAYTTDVVLERLARSQGKMGADCGFTGSRTSALLASLCAESAGGTLYDPACGIGAALMRAVDAGIKPSRVVGHDINRAAVRVARQRAFLRDVDIELALGDVLEHDLAPDLKADVIIAEPPFGMSFSARDALFDPRYRFGRPPKSSGDWAWVQHVVEHLKDGGRAYVVLTSGGLNRASERAIRMGLVGAGCVEAVVGLPGKMLPHVSVPLALLVLRRPSVPAAESEVLFIDASEQVAPEHEVARWLSDPSDLVRPPHITVGAADVLAKDARLEPRAWLPAVGPDACEVVRSFTDGWKEVLQTAGEIDEQAPAAPTAVTFTRPRIATVGELTSEGILKIWGGGRPEEKYADMGYPKSFLARVATASDVHDGRLRSSPLPVEPGSNLHKPHLTDAGDLLVTTWNEVRARIDVAGSHLPGAGVHRVKIRDLAALDPEYLAITLAGPWNKRFLRGSTIPRAKLSDLEVPLVPLAEQHSIVTSLRGVEKVEHLAARLSEGAATVRTAYLAALRYDVDLTSTNPEGTAE
ncbi:N-6 DNA methylase [Georgenia faecalis]|uniref:N-6 DNA methylase n=1 Tax=Georgenia faecalis TaxID=2483799 RepID=A0ABV9DAQ3_9MICO|nr:N-6 DNA methylase [Georgenia faecalis]